MGVKTFSADSGYAQASFVPEKMRDPVSIAE